MRNIFVPAFFIFVATVASMNDNPNRLFQLRELKTATVKFDKKQLTVWIMDTESKRNEGMMFLRDKEVRKDAAMIFVFSDWTDRRFWMHNTLIPLDIAYIGKNGVTVSTATMKALDDTGVPSHGAAQYAIEMKAGSFRRLGIKKGVKFAIPATVVAKD